jgi:polynucleotide kinase-phosphatase
MRLELPCPSLVLLVGASASGKSTFARRYFAHTEIVSSDACRALVSDDETDQNATVDAFEVLNTIVEKRLQRHLTTVIDATNVQPEARRPLLALARKYHMLPIALVFDLPSAVLDARNVARAEGTGRPPIPSRVVAHQRRDLHRGLKTLRREGFSHVFVFESAEEVGACELVRVPLRPDRRGELGPFDLIGDVHGCFDELHTLLGRLGYAVDRAGAFEWRVTPPPGRRVVFLGDLVDRGPNVVDVLSLAMQMVRDGQALCVPGNHDLKLARKLRGRDVKVAHGLAESLAQLDTTPEAFREDVATFFDEMTAHLVLDEGRLVVAHAGLKRSMHGRASAAVRDFALYGDTTGEIDAFGLPVRLDWAAAYTGRATVVYGHTPVPRAEWVNGTIDLDTGCVFGGALTALRYPERELVSVPAAQVYYTPIRPLAPEAAEVPPVAPAGPPPPDAPGLDLATISGKSHLETRLLGRIRVGEGEAAAALETVSRFSVDPRWLIYVPPTMSPAETSARPNFLEHPDEAFAYYREQGVTEVVCQKKHMGSRAIVVVLRRPEVAITRFGFARAMPGVVYSRTGRPFFNDAALGEGFLDRLRGAVERAGLFDALETDWLCLDAEMLPWSLKARSLIEQQYAPTGAAGLAGLTAAVEALRHAPAAAALLARFEGRLARVRAYDQAWRPYCWPVEGLSDVRCAPFHLLAAEGRTFFDRPHAWHMEQLETLAGGGVGLLEVTPNLTVDLGDAAACAAAVEWWQAHTDAGGEGMVVKPQAFVSNGPRGLLQPAIKVRGREYLRIIYGPEYDAPEHLERLRSRAVKAKRRLAAAEFALGVEALSLFIEHAPLARVHACAFGVLALESEALDPRL